MIKIISVEYVLNYSKFLHHWPNLKKEVAEFVARCMEFQQVKLECKHPVDLLHSILILEWKWEVVSMDFFIGLTRTSKQHDSNMVLVDRLSKVTHFIAVKSTNSANEVAHIFIKEIVRLQGLPMKIILDGDAKFTSKFWKDLFAGLGT